jgi:hypothetical protein
VARIRTIKPEILEDEKTASLTSDQWRLYVSMITLADDYGNLRAHPNQVKGAVFWAMENAPDVTRLLAELATAGLILLYQVSGQAYAHIVGWKKHQKVDHPGSPRCPGPENQIVTQDSRGPREDLASDSRLTPTPISTPTPIRAREGEKPSAFPMTGHGILTQFSSIRADVFPNVLPWALPPAARGKADTMADSLVGQPGIEAEVTQSMRMFWNAVKAGTRAESAKISSNLSFAFGAWCSDLHGHREKIQGRAPSTPARAGPLGAGIAGATLDTAAAHNAMAAKAIGKQA